MLLSNTCFAYFIAQQVCSHVCCDLQQARQAGVQTASQAVHRHQHVELRKGYDPDDHDKNAAYYEPWYKRMVPSRLSAAVDDTLNKYQVRHMPDACFAFWHLLLYQGLCISVVGAIQEYCRLVHNRDAVPVTSCEDLRAFYEWFVVRVQKIDSGAIVIGRS